MYKKLVVLNRKNSYHADIKNKQKCSIDSYEFCVLSNTPEKFFAGNQDSGMSIAIEMENHKTKAIAMFGGDCIATSKMVPKELQDCIDKEDAFCAVYLDAQECMHFIWIENMGKKYRSCSFDSHGLEPDEIRRMVRELIKLVPLILGKEAIFQKQMETDMRLAGE